MADARLLQFINKTKAGCNRTISSVGVEKTESYFDYMSLHCEDSIQIFHTTLQLKWCIIIPSLVTKGTVVQKLDRIIVDIQIPNVHSDLEHSNLIFSHNTLAHDNIMPSLVTKYWEVLQILSIILSFKKLSYGGTMNKETGPWKVSLTASNPVNVTNLPFCVQRHGVMTFPIFRPIKAQKSKQRPRQHKPLRKHTTKSRLTYHNLFVCLTCLMLTLGVCACVRACVHMHACVRVCCTCMYELRIVSMDKILHFINNVIIIITLLLQYWLRPKSIWEALKSW